jgi:hypothetical protein
MTMTPTGRADVSDASVVDDAAAMWAGVMRDYRAALESQRQILGRVHDDQEIGDLDQLQPFVAPAGLPPMPTAFREDAVALDAETTELLAAARELLARLKPPSSAPVHRSILAPPSPSQMDTRL